MLYCLCNNYLLIKLFAFCSRCQRRFDITFHTTMGNCVGKVLLHSSIDNCVAENTCDYCKTHDGLTAKDQPGLCYCAIPVSRVCKYVTKPVATDTWTSDTPCNKWFSYDGMKVSYCQNRCAESHCCELLNNSKDCKDIVREKLSATCNSRQKENIKFSCYSKVKSAETDLFPVTIIRCPTPDNCFPKKC